jgi:hypothetical protein
MRALAREPEHRYQDAAQIKREVEAAPAAPVAPGSVRRIYPCARFAITDVSRWFGGSARGEIYRDETTLILEFSIESMWGTKTHREVRIPLTQLLTISCQGSGRSGRSSKLRIGKAIAIGIVTGGSKSSGRGRTEIVLKVRDPAAIAELPVGKHGRGRLQVHRADGEAAQQLVASILGNPVAAPGRPGRAVPLRVREPVNPIDPQRIRRQLLGPAVGLMLTAAGALLCAVGVVAGFIRELRWMDNRETALYGSLIAVVACLVLSAAAVMMAGAMRMMIGRKKYILCVVAAMLALVPWSPAWLIGLPVGIWAVIVLARPEVMAAFLDKPRGESAVPAAVPEPTGRVAGRLRSWLRSFAGYFLTIAPGTRRQQINKNDE